MTKYYVASSHKNAAFAAVSHRRANALSKSHTVLKRAFDIVVASFALLLVWPILLVAALLVRIDNHESIIFTQRRIGLHGKPFMIYKFRTMRSPTTEAQKMHHVGPLDPQLTRIGRFLRNTSVDELPQLWNILKGEMSVVGPRPQADYHAAHYAQRIPHYQHRYDAKPGLTGPVQVSPLRSQTDTLEVMTLRAEMDIDYVQNMSFWRDIKICLQTFVQLALPFRLFMEHRPISQSHKSD